MNFGATLGRTFGVFSSKSSHFVPLWARSSFFLRSRQFSGPGLADKCQKTITEITGGPNVLFFASNFANSELSSGSWELITRSTGSRGFPGSGTEAADRTLGNTRRSLRMTWVLNKLPQKRHLSDAATLFSYSSQKKTHIEFHRKPPKHLTIINQLDFFSVF